MNSAELKKYSFSVNGIILELSWAAEPFHILRLKLDTTFDHPTDSQDIFPDSPNQLVGKTLCELRRFLNGEIKILPVDNLEIKGLSTFALNILNTLRQTVPYGTTISYGKLAEYAGYPGAARAAGTVLKNNHFPLFFPCHRVIRSNGSCGMFQGSEEDMIIKKHLINLEKQYA